MAASPMVLHLTGRWLSGIRQDSCCSSFAFVVNEVSVVVGLLLLGACASLDGPLTHVCEQLISLVITALLRPTSHEDLFRV